MWFVSDIIPSNCTCIKINHGFAEFVQFDAIVKSLRNVLDEKVNAHLPYYSTLKKFWNGFFQTFQAGLLFFSGGNTQECTLTIKFNFLYSHKCTVKSLFSAVLNLVQSSFYRRSSKRGWK